MSEKKDVWLTTVEREVVDLPVRAQQIAIKSNDGLIIANDFLLAVKKMGTDIRNFFKPLKDKARAMHQALLDQEKNLLSPVYQAEKLIKDSISTYVRQQEEQRRAEEESARKAEEERALLERQAQMMEDSGKIEEAKEMRDSAPAPVAFVPQEKTKLQGASLKKIPKWRVIDERLVPREYLMLDSAKITKAVKSSSGSIIIPGIHVYMEDSVAASRG